MIPSHAPPGRSASPTASAPCRGPRAFDPDRRGRRAVRAHRVAAGHRRLLHRLPLVRFARTSGRCGEACSAPRSRSPSSSRSLFFALCWANLLIAERIAPPFRPSRSRGRPDRALPRAGRAADRRWCGSLSLACSGADRRGEQSGRWNEWILFTHRVDFGQKDADLPHRHRLLRLPAAVPDRRRRAGCSRRCWSSCSSPLLAHYRERRHPVPDAARPGHAAGQGPPVGAARRARPGARPGATGCSRYELTFSTRGTVDGATYTDVNVAAARRSTC